MSIFKENAGKAKMDLERKVFLRCENGEYFYKGPKPFLDLIKKLLPGQIIRVYNYGTIIDPHYVIGSEGRLYDVNSQNLVDPRRILSKKSAPDGWSFEGGSLGFLPDDELRKAVEYFDKPKS